jgi:hypothetical protein
MNDILFVAISDSLEKHYHVCLDDRLAEGWRYPHYLL